MPDYALYDAEAGLCSPLHIGNGETLLADYDFVARRGWTWRLNLDTLLADRVDDPALGEQLETIAPGTLLGPQDFQRQSPLFLYVMPGVPRSAQTGAQVMEQIKDVWNQPYLPGSSLKGALRTALLWYAMTTQGREVDVRRLGRRAQWAAQGLERDVMGQDPNHDLLRALHVADSEPAGSDTLMLVNVKVVSAAMTGSPIELEAIRPGVLLRTQIKIDLALFSRWAQERGLHLGAGRAWLEDIPGIVSRFSKQRLQRALSWCGGRTDRAQLARFYRDQTREEGANVCRLQIGWGGGWDSKTIGPVLQENPAQLEEIIRAYSLHRGQPRRPGSPFPSTRRMAMRLIQDAGGQQREVPAAPLGWVRLVLQRRN